jgi:nitrogenase molybdenum-iron protein alpha/beta subunit
MDKMIETPFESIESAHEYLGLLGEALQEAQGTIQEDIEAVAQAGADESARRLQALQLVSYKLDQLRQHLGASSRILNDLRTLRRLLMGVGALPRVVGRATDDVSVE